MLLGIPARASLQGRCSKNPIAGGFIPNFIPHPRGTLAVLLQMIYFNRFISPGPHSLPEKKKNNQHQKAVLSHLVWVRSPSAERIARGGGGCEFSPSSSDGSPGFAGGGWVPAVRTPRRALAAPVQHAAAFNICFQSPLRLTSAGKSQAFPPVRGLKGTGCGQNPPPAPALEPFSLKKFTPAGFSLYLIAKQGLFIPG